MTGERDEQLTAPVAELVEQVEKVLRAANVNITLANSTYLRGFEALRALRTQLERYERALREIADLPHGLSYTGRSIARSVVWSSQGDELPTTRSILAEREARASVALDGETYAVDPPSPGEPNDSEPLEAGHHDIGGEG